MWNNFAVYIYIINKFIIFRFWIIQIIWNIRKYLKYSSIKKTQKWKGNQADLSCPTSNQFIYLSTTTRSSFSPTDKNAQYNSKRFRTRSNENNNDNSNPDSVHAISSFTHLSNSNNSTNQIDPFLKVTKSIWAYYTKNAQGIECYQKKLELKNALMFMFEDVFPCRCIWPYQYSTFKRLTSDFFLYCSRFKRPGRLYCRLEHKRIRHQWQWRWHVFHGVKRRGTSFS